ncbi:MAG TPA: gamma-glutamyltransferase, partial [Longimicrobiales bacterium]|nr:gamma-glutamyltransferase [Longimicrobiales bacterium]
LAQEEEPRRAQAVRSSGGMVVSATAYASRVGAEVLEAGGNAIDAAVATGFALAVTHPTAGTIGGGGFFVVRRPDGTTTTFEFREKAPLAAHPEMFVDPETGEYAYERHHASHLAVGVPGTVAGFALAHERLGSLPWARLVDPALRAASGGIEVTPTLARSLRSVLPRMEDYPASVAAFSRDGVPYEAGDTLRQADLGRTLARIRDGGADGFYRGETARLLAAEMRRGGGLITEEDLARYQANERAPIRGTFRDWEVISMPPPSSGGIALVEMLNILEGFDLAAMGPGSAPYLHHLAEAMRRAYRDRAEFVADPDFADVPIERLTSKSYAAQLRAAIDRERATPSSPTDIPLADESPETTHYSVVDAAGMAVSVTYTLEQGYGSKIVVPGAGFLLNNEMGDFNARPGLTDESGLIGTQANLARPEQRMISSMTPTIIARDGRLVAVVGSPGGRTIINTVLQMVLNLTEHGMSLEEAQETGRMHHQWLPDRIRLERDAVGEEVVAALEAMGHEVSVGGRQGSAHVIHIDTATGERIGVADPRDGDGAASAAGRAATDGAEAAQTDGAEAAQAEGARGGAEPSAARVPAPLP